MTYPRQAPCPCGVHSSAVCAYSNWTRTCYGRPDLIPKTKKEAEALKNYFAERRKKK